MLLCFHKNVILQLFKSFKDWITVFSALGIEVESPIRSSGFLSVGVRTWNVKPDRPGNAQNLSKRFKPSFTQNQNLK